MKVAYIFYTLLTNIRKYRMNVYLKIFYLLSYS